MIWRRISLLDNERFIAARRAMVVLADQKRREAAIKLSLFWRDAMGQPRVPQVDFGKVDFPATPMAIWTDSASQEAEALARRPELQQLQWQIRQVNIDLQQASNLTLPKLDAIVSGSQDLGSPTSSKRDKSRFELEAGLIAEVPWQRRDARGKIRAAQGKLAQLQAKRQMAGDKVIAELRAAAVAADSEARQLELDQLNLKLTLQARDLAEESFNAGDIDLIVLNIYETAATTAAIEVIEAKASLFIALADYQAALGLPPTLPSDNGP